MAAICRRKAALICLLCTISFLCFNVSSFSLTNPIKIKPAAKSAFQKSIASVLVSLSVSVMLTSSPANAATGDIKPTDKDNQLVQMAFRDFDLKRFVDSEKEFTLSIAKWREIDRPRYHYIKKQSLCI